MKRPSDVRSTSSLAAEQARRDEGISGKAEVRRELGFVPAALSKTSLYGFYDIAAVWKQDQSDRQSAARGGLGWAIEGARCGDFIELAKPLTHADAEGKRDSHAFAQVRVKF